MAAEEPCIYDACSDNRGVAVECQVCRSMVARDYAVRIEQLGGPTGRVGLRRQRKRPPDGTQGAGRIHIVGIQQADDITRSVFDSHVDSVIKPTTAILKDDDVRTFAKHLKRTVDGAAVHDDMLHVALLL